LDWLAMDARTRAILLYIESIEAPRKFMSAARAAARNKPVILVKAGRSLAGQQAAASHTGALAGSDAVFDAAIRRAGMLRVDTLQQLFTAAETLARLERGSTIGAATPALTVVTNGGGAGVLAADAVAAAGLALAPLSEPTRAALDAVLPSTWSHANPVDLIGDAPVERYVGALQTLLADPASGLLLVMHAPTAIVPSLEIADALVPLLQPAAARVLGCWLGDAAVAAARQRFQAAGICCYDTPEQAVQAVAMLAEYRRNQAQLIETPPAAVAEADAMDLDAVRVQVAAVLAEGREWLSEPEAKTLLAACGVPVAMTRICAPTPVAAAETALAIGFPVALKILSPELSHKSDVGGVVLDLGDADQVARAASAMLERVRTRRPDATIAGFTVQQMVRRARAHELIVGASVDAQFGPVILFGQGGTAVEVVADRALALPPLNLPLARALVDRTRVAKLLRGYRDVPPVHEGALLGTLITVSRLLAEVPEIAELDINPLLADADGVIALDARVRVSAARPAGAGHFAIRPYPRQLEEQFDWQGRTITLRPIRPEDEAPHLAFLRRLDPEDVRLRVFYSRRTIEHSELARLTQIDYDREMAFVATTTGADGEPETLAVVRAAADPDNEAAEFGIVVRSDLKGAGLGTRLMHKLIHYLRAHGTQRLTALVLNENQRMLGLGRRLGFSVGPRTVDGTRTMELALQDGAAPATDPPVAN
ncbi:MAG: GNAT family N-acetyltransferase, partial [Rubrivivax sp.]